MNSNDPTESNGPANGDRDARGRFAPGNPGGPGNPRAADVGRLRARFFASIKDENMDRALAVIVELMDKTDARDSDRLAAARELIDRVIGKAVAADLLERIERLESLLSAREQDVRGGTN